MADSTSTFPVKIVPDVSGFADALRAAVAEVTAEVGATVTTTEAFTYNAEGQVTGHTTVRTIGPPPPEDWRLDYNSQTARAARSTLVGEGQVQ